MKKQQIVCLTTDFGNLDPYVGVVKGIILAAAPLIQIVDLTHAIPPQNIRAAAFVLMSSAAHFPKGTFFISIVDPGVGSERKILYAETGGQRFMAPDNGLLSWIFEEKKPSKLFAVSPQATLKKDISRTFHGRDIFAPVAGRLLNGESPSTIGSPVKKWVEIPFPIVKKTGSQWEGEVIYVDGFGNLITNIINKDLQSLTKSAKLWFEFGLPEKPFSVRGLVNSYTESEKGKLLALPGSAGFIEISVRDGNAAQVTGLKTGSSVTLHFRI